MRGCHNCNTALPVRAAAERMRRIERRTFLAGAGSVATATGLVGCLSGRSGTGDGDAGDEREDGERRAASENGTGDAGRATVQGVDVGPSPGGPIPVLPAGKVALLDFWATWCAPCKPQMDKLRAVRAEYPDVHMLSITNETNREAIRSFWREHDGTWPVAVDPDLATNDRFGVTRIPTLLVFAPDGERVWEHTGLAATEDVMAALEAASSGS